MVVTGGVRFAVLGPVRAWRDDVELDLGSPQQRATLAVLLLRNGARVSAEELVDAVWAEDPPRAAIGAIRTYVYRLRRCLAGVGQGPVIESVGGGYALLTGPDTVDLRVFREEVARARQARADDDPATASQYLRDALAHWNGAPLGGIKGNFAQTQRTALVRLRLSAIEDLLGVDLELGNHARVVAELSTLIEEYPLHERLRELLMLALYRSGRQAEALELFRDTSRLLADELGVSPGPALQEMHRRILAADRALILDLPSEPAPVARTPREEPGTAIDLETIQGQAPEQVMKSPRMPRIQSPVIQSPADQVAVQAPTNPAPAIHSPVTQISAGQLVPGQLPPDFPDFAGRAEPIARISRLLTGATAIPVVGIAGLAGVGKTALAVHIGHAVRSLFPDGQVFVTLTGANDERIDPHGVLGFLLRAFGIPNAELPETVSQRSALWRSVLSGRRVLVILDDAHDSAQILDLLAGSAGCAVIITSQRRLVQVPGAQWLKLDALQPDEALGFFEQIAGRDRVRSELDVAKRLAKAFSYMPLPLRMAASRLNARPHWGLAAVEAQLFEELRRSTAMQDDCRVAAAPFERAYRRLDARLARAFRLIAVGTGPDITAAAAAAALGSSPDEAQSLLESLADLHLVEVAGPGWYRYHHLVREYGRYLAFQQNDQTAGATVGELSRLRRRASDRLSAVS